MLECWDDVASDMSVFHRIEEVEAMSGRRFFAFAIRLPAYAGAVRARLAMAASTEPPAAAPAAVPRQGAQGVMPGTRAAIQASEFADLFSWGG